MSGIGWWDDPLEDEIRDAVDAEKPADVLAARFPEVPADARDGFLTRYQTETDDRELLVRRFAHAVEAYRNEQRDRTQSRLKRIWRLLR